MPKAYKRLSAMTLNTSIPTLNLNFADMPNLSSHFCLLEVGYYSLSKTCPLEVSIILFLTILIISGNLVVIFVFHFAPSLSHHTSSAFIQTMAYADLLVGVSCLFPVMSLLNHVQGLEPKFSCQMFGYLVSVLKSVSMVSLACVSVDRYIAITQPLKYTSLVSPCRVRCCIVLI